MATILVKSKNRLTDGKKPRVYFTCHPEDFALYFEKICEDIFATHDVAVYYTEDMSAPIRPEDQATDLGRNNLFVVPVTFKLLTTPNRAMDEDIPYALREHIPVLPFMMESDIDQFYAQPDKFGELQYLNPYSSDATEVAYAEKLKKHLDAILISDKLAKRVRAAFDAYIFLSYRKKDRKYANELMRLIHQNPECRDIAIWFDEFLTPGESFKENIEKVLDDCDLFALLVTPRLLEKVLDENGVERDNYVLANELPMARRKQEEKGTAILAVEMEPTDPDALAELIDTCVNGRDPAFRQRLLEAIAQLATTANDTPEHNFLIGLAYLDGIDVEVDRGRALELITSAAENDLPEAMRKLHNMYDSGTGVALDYRQAMHWAEQYADFCRRHYGEEDPKTLSAIQSLAVTCNDAGEYRKALALNEKLYPLRCKILGEEHPHTLATLGNLATSYSATGDLRTALTYKEKVYRLRCKLFGEEHPSTLVSLNNLATSYDDLGDFKTAVEMKEKVYALRRKLLGEDHPDTLISMNNLAVSYGELGDRKRQRELLEKVYEQRRKTLGEGHPKTLISMSNLATVYSADGEHQRALELKQKVYAIRCELLGEEHPKTMVALSNLASSHDDLGHYRTSLEMNQKVYAVRCRILGERHPDTLISMSKIASSHDRLNEHEQALEIKQKVYAIRCELLGEEHPKTLLILSNISYSYDQLGRHTEAREIKEKIYAIRRETLGEKHPKTLLVLNNLSTSYIRLGQYQKALECLQHVYEAQCEVLGEEHPDTLITLYNISDAYRRLGDLATERMLVEKVYTLRCKVLGKEHPKTVKVYNHLRRLQENT